MTLKQSGNLVGGGVPCWPLDRKQGKDMSALASLFRLLLLQFRSNPVLLQHSWQTGHLKDFRTTFTCLCKITSFSFWVSECPTSSFPCWRWWCCSGQKSLYIGKVEKEQRWPVHCVFLIYLCVHLPVLMGGATHLLVHCGRTWPLLNIQLCFVVFRRDVGLQLDSGSLSFPLWHCIPSPSGLVTPQRSQHPCDWLILFSLEAGLTAAAHFDFSWF